MLHNYIFNEISLYEVEYLKIVWFKKKTNEEIFTVCIVTNSQFLSKKLSLVLSLKNTYKALRVFLSSSWIIKKIKKYFENTNTLNYFPSLRLCMQVYLNEWRGDPGAQSMRNHWISCGRVVISWELTSTSSETGGAHSKQYRRSLQ